jgi:hypothetical protein
LKCYDRRVCDYTLYLFRIYGRPFTLFKEEKSDGI